MRYIDKYLFTYTWCWAVLGRPKIPGVGGGGPLSKSQSGRRWWATGRIIWIKILFSSIHHWPFSCCKGNNALSICEYDVEISWDALTLTSFGPNCFASLPPSAFISHQWRSNSVFHRSGMGQNTRLGRIRKHLRLYVVWFYPIAHRDDDSEIHPSYGHTASLPNFGSESLPDWWICIFWMYQSSTSLLGLSPQYLFGLDCFTSLLSTIQRAISKQHLLSVSPEFHTSIFPARCPL